MAKTLYTISEVAGFLNISKTSVFRLLKEGKFQAVCIKNKYYIFIDSFNNWFYGVSERKK